MARSYKRLRESLEDERKRRKELEDELDKTQKKLSVKLRLLERYKELSSETELVLSKKLNKGDVEEMKRENVLRSETDNYILRLRETEEKLHVALNHLEEFNKDVEDKQNVINNQEYLIKQLQALNSEKTSEIKNFQELVNKNKKTVDLNSSLEPRYISSLKHAIAYGEFLLKKKVPLTKKHKHWLSNAHIWLEQLGEKKFKLPITSEDWENQEASTGNVNQASNLNSSFGTVDESIDCNSMIEVVAGSKGCEQSLNKNPGGSPSSTVWPDEGFGSPRLSVITQISNISETSYVSFKSIGSVCSSADSGISSLDEIVSKDKCKSNEKTNYSEDLLNNFTDSCKVNKDEEQKSTIYLRNKNKQLSLPDLNEGLDLSSTECQSKCVKSIFDPKFSLDVCGKDKPSENKHISDGITFLAGVQRVTPLSTGKDETKKEICSEVDPSPVKDKINSVECIFDPAFSHKTASVKKKVIESDGFLVNAEIGEQQKDTLPILDSDIDGYQNLQDVTTKQNVIENSISDLKKVNHNILFEKGETITDKFQLEDPEICKSNSEVKTVEPSGEKLNSKCNESGKSTWTGIESNLNNDALQANELITEYMDSVESSLDVPCASELVEFVNNEKTESLNSIENILLNDVELTNSDDDLVVLGEHESEKLNNINDDSTTDFSSNNMLNCVDPVKLKSMSEDKFKKTVETLAPVSCKNIHYSSGCVKVLKFPGNICIVQVVKDENGVDNSSSLHDDHTYSCSWKNISEGGSLSIQKLIKSLPQPLETDFNNCDDNNGEHLSVELKNKILEITGDTSSNFNEVYFTKSSAPGNCSPYDHSVTTDCNLKIDSKNQNSKKTFEMCDETNQASHFPSITQKEISSVGVICEKPVTEDLDSDHNLDMETDLENKNSEEAVKIYDGTNQASHVSSITQKEISSVSGFCEKPVTEDLDSDRNLGMETDLENKNSEEAVKIYDETNQASHVPSITQKEISSVGGFSERPVTEDLGTVNICPSNGSIDKSFEINCKTSESLQDGNLYSCRNPEISIDRRTNLGFDEIHKTDVVSEMEDPEENDIYSDNESSSISEVTEPDEHFLAASLNSHEIKESAKQFKDSPSSDFNDQLSAKSFETKGNDDGLHELKSNCDLTYTTAYTELGETHPKIKNSDFLETSKRKNIFTCVNSLKTSGNMKTELLCEKNYVEGESNISGAEFGEKLLKNSLVPENDSKDLFENVSTANSLMDTGIVSNDLSSNDINKSLSCNKYESASVDSGPESNFKNCLSSVSNSNKDVTDTKIFELKTANSCDSDGISDCEDTELESLLSEIKCVTSVGSMRIVSPFSLKSPIRGKTVISPGRILVKEKSLCKKLLKESSLTKPVTKLSNNCNKLEKSTLKDIVNKRKIFCNNNNNNSQDVVEKQKSMPLKISKLVSSDDDVNKSKQSSSSTIAERNEKQISSGELISNESTKSNDIASKESEENIPSLESTDNDVEMVLNNIFSSVFCPDLVTPIYDLTDKCSNSELMVKNIDVLDPVDSKVVEGSRVDEISGCNKNTHKPVSEVKPLLNVTNQNKAKDVNVKQIVTKELSYDKLLSSDDKEDLGNEKMLNDKICKEFKFERNTDVNEKVNSRCRTSQSDEKCLKDTFPHTNNVDQIMNEETVEQKIMIKAHTDRRIIKSLVKNHSNSAQNIHSKRLASFKGSFKKLRRERIKKKCTLVDGDGSEESYDSSGNEDDNFIGFSMGNDFSLVESELQKINCYFISNSVNFGVKEGFSETPINNNSNDNTDLLLQKKIQNSESLECNLKENSDNFVAILPSCKKEKIKEIITSDESETMSEDRATNISRNNCKEVVARSQICVESEATEKREGKDKLKRNGTVKDKAVALKNVNFDDNKNSNLKKNEIVSKALNLRRSTRLLACRTEKEGKVESLRNKLNSSKICKKTECDSEQKSLNNSSPKKTISCKRSISATVSCEDSVKVDSNNDCKIEEIKLDNTVNSKMLLRGRRKISGREMKSPSHDLCKYCCGNTTLLVPNLPHQTFCDNSTNSLEISRGGTCHPNCRSNNENHVNGVKNVKFDKISENFEVESLNEKCQRFDKAKKRALSTINPIKKLSGSSEFKLNHSAQNSKLVTKKKGSDCNKLAQSDSLDIKDNEPLINRLSTDKDNECGSDKNLENLKTRDKFSDWDNKEVTDTEITELEIMSSDNQTNFVKSNNLPAFSNVKTFIKTNSSYSPMNRENLKIHEKICRNQNKTTALSSVNEPVSSVQNGLNSVKLKAGKTVTTFKHTLSDKLPQVSLDNEVSEELKTNSLHQNNSLELVPTLLGENTGDIGNNNNDSLELPSVRLFQSSSLSEKSNTIFSNIGSIGLPSIVLSPPLSPEISSEISSPDNKNSGFENSSVPSFNFYLNANEEEIQIRKRKLSELSASDMNCISSPKKLCVSSSDITPENNELFIGDKCESHIQDEVPCQDTILQTAFIYHKESLFTGKQKKMAKKLKLKEAKDCRIAEKALGAVQELSIKSEQFSSEFLNDTLKRLRSCDQKPVAEMFIDLICIDTDEVVKDLIPPMTSLQRYIFPVAYQLCCDPDYPDFLLSFLKSVKTTLFSNNEICLVVPSENLAKFSTLLCRSVQAFDAMRWFMYDVLYMLRYKAIPIIQVMLTQWPGLMPYARDANDCPLSICINHVIGSYKVENYYSKYYNSSRLKALMKNFYGYQMGELSRDQVFDRLFKSISKKGFIEAMILLCKKEGYDWTVAKIHQIFLPMLDSWRTGCVNESIIAIVITTLGYILRPFPPNAAEKITHEVVAQLEKIMVDLEGSSVMQEAAVISICRLSRLNFDYCISVLQKWKPKNQAVSKNVLETMKFMIAYKKPIWWQKYFSRCFITN